MRSRVAPIIFLLMVAAAGAGSADDLPLVISGTVNGPGNAPVEGATVEAMFLWGANATSTTTGADGTYQLSMPIGPIVMYVRPTLASRLVQSYANLGFHEQPVTQDFQLGAGFLLSGTVLMPDNSAPSEQIEVVPHSISYEPTGDQWLKTRTTAGTGDFSVVLPAGVYWVGVTPPASAYSVETQVDLSSGDVAGVLIQLSDELVHPIPLDPPDPSKITVGEIDDLGEAVVTGAAGAAMPLAHVLLVNLHSLNQAYTVSAADGSFSARLFAPPGSAILVKHGGTPTEYWNELAVGASMKISYFPGTIFHLPHVHQGEGGSQPFATVATDDFFVDFEAETTNWVGSVWALTGHLGPTDVFDPGDEIRIEGTARVYGPGIDTSGDLGEVSLSANLLLLKLADEAGRPIAGQKFMSSRLTPTGLPIQGSTPPGRPTQLSVAIEDFTVSGEHSVEGQLELTGNLPPDLNPGLYLPLLHLDSNGFTTSTQWLAAEVYAPSYDHVQAPLPPIVISSVDELRLIWRLLMENPVQGIRGTSAVEDRGVYEFAQDIVVQGAPYIIPPVDHEDRPISYRLEPYLPRISFADRRIPAQPLIPFQLPGGQLNVVIEAPDETVSELGSAEFTQSLSRSATTGSAREINPGTTQITDYYSLTTGDDRFQVTFDQYGRHYILMNGTVDDLWGHTYSGGGTYEVWVAHVLDVDPGVLPGTPLAVDDVFNPAIQVSPRVPAEVELSVTLYPDSNPDLATTQTVTGRCNEYGLFSVAGDSVILDRPGEYRVDLTARYTTDSGKMYMGAMTWGGVVMTPAAEAELVPHGRRGLDALDEIPDQSWFVSYRDLEIIPGKVNHTYNPYYNGDMLWTRFSDYDANRGVVDGGDSLIIGASVHDTVGTIEAAIAARAQIMNPELSAPGTISERIRAGEIPLFSSTTSGLSPLIAPAEIDQIAYAYRYSERPGVRVREMVGEDYENGGYWRLDTVYDDQLGVGTLGDQVNDFKYQFVGIVYRDLATGHSEYLGQGTGWIFIPDSDPIGSRCMPPFAGQGNGGWTTEGGPLLTLKNQDIHIFILPTGVRPGAVLEVGDTFRFAGHVMPTLGSQVALTVTSPSGQAHQVDGRANTVGYFYDSADDFVITEPGVWTVEVDVWHDGQCSGGSTVSPYPSGDLLGADQGRYWFYVVEPGQARLGVKAPLPGMLTFGNNVTPIEIVGLVPEELDAATVDYTISMPGFILEHGQVRPDGPTFSIVLDPVSLNKDFPNFDLQGRDDQRAGLSDTVSIGLMLSGSVQGTEVFFANTLTIQGQEVYVGGDGKGVPLVPDPRRASGRLRP